ncbi:exodeoxyribonuclease VII small subunit [Arsenicicoccus sp. UBA7492]|jgi:exodeoxyribonuclease VII small subunit|uniref:exodeoxyribonuclease VII small subunit n=1 Tax=Arsenicicoccus sp. UBA7492 TaxID=1946057 RepID=UPI00257D0AC7|nr:exodeoxyribonuclease VII small subunit [Arsenicicoccus sp. UBA7492]
MADLKPPSTERPIEDLTYEQARDELVTIVSQLEAGQLPLEDSLRLWERGEALAAHCSTWLDQAEARLTGDATASAPGANADADAQDDEA